MKKILIFLLALICFGCQQKEDPSYYYHLSMGGVEVIPGYTKVSELVDLSFEAPEELGPGEDIYAELYDSGYSVGEIRIFNPSEEKAPLGDCRVVYIDLYKVFYGDIFLDEELLSDSIKENCETRGGTYFYQNGYACKLEKKSHSRTSVIILHGDISAMDQDLVDRVEVFAE